MGTAAHYTGPLGNGCHTAPSENSLAIEEGRKGVQENKAQFNLFNQNHLEKLIGTSAGNKKSLKLDLQR